MKVIHLCSSDIQGGAARAAFAINKALIESGIDSTMLVQKKFSNDNSVFPFVDSPSKELKYAYRYFWDYVYIYYLTIKERGRFSFPYWGVEIAKNPLVKEADIIHLHWINQGYFSFNTFQTLAKLNKPIVWTFHDMWAFTGGCHYNLGCQNFTIICNDCPSLKFRGKNDSSNKIFLEKEKLFNNLKFNIVTCSRWLAGEVKKSFLLKDYPINVIPNTLDFNIFKPIDKKIARSTFNLPENKFFILFGTMNVEDKRKGFDLLKAALTKLYNDYSSFRDKIEILVFGSADQSGALEIPFKVNFLGRIKTDEKIVLSYNCADIFVAPSIEDNLPNTVMEALSCGIPVAAFNIGGMPDMIEHKKNGYLAEPGSTNDLSRGIYWLLQEKSENSDFNSAAREKVLNNFKPEMVAEKYIQLYKLLLKI